MKRTILLATTALVALAIPALADGKGGKRLTGLGDIGYTYIDVDSVFSDSVSNFHGTGSALWTWPDKWNAQANFDFNSFHQDPFGASVWRLGGAGFWRDVNEGMLGGELHYQSIDGGIGYADGVEIRGRGELFLSEATIGAHLGYSTFDELDGWLLGAYGTYYASPHLGLRLGIDYGSWDATPDDFDQWSLNGEVEYLFPGCDTSVYAGLGFGSIDEDLGSDEDYWQLGIGARVHFGTDGALIKRNREEPLRALRSISTF